MKICWEAKWEGVDLKQPFFLSCRVAAGGSRYPTDLRGLVVTVTVKIPGPLPPRAAT